MYHKAAWYDKVETPNYCLFNELLAVLRKRENMHVYRDRTQPHVPNSPISVKIAGRDLPEVFESILSPLADRVHVTFAGNTRYIFLP